jgi:hypothetical protein
VQHHRVQRWLIALLLLGIAYPIVFWLLGLSEESRLVLSDVAAFGSASIGATAATIAGLRKTQYRVAWRWLAVGLWLLALGEGTWSWIEVIQDGEPFPSLADAFYVPAYIGLLLGVLALARTPTVWTRARATMDALLFTFAAFIPLWRHVLLPIFQDPSANLLEQTLGVLYPVGDIVLLLALGLLMARQFPSCRKSVYVFAAGLAVSLIADIAFALVGEDYAAGNLMDFLWYASFLIMAAAAILEIGGEAEAQQTETVGVWRNALPVLTLVPLAIWAVYAGYSGQLNDDVTPLLLGLYGIALAARQVVGILDFRASTATSKMPTKSLPGSTASSRSLLPPRRSLPAMISSPASLTARASWRSSIAWFPAGRLSCSRWRTWMV